MFPVSAQREAVRLKPQTGLSELQGSGADFAHQAAQAAGARQASGANGARARSTKRG
jgi:hypothetical protein